MNLTVSLDDGAQQIIDRIRSRTTLQTYQDIFSEALALLDWAASHYHDGRTVAAVDERERTYRELQTKVLGRTAAAA